MERDIRLQALSRGDEGFLLALGYSTQRGYARNHPFVGEIRIGEVEVELDVPELPSPCRSAASGSPNARWSTSSRARPRRRRSSPAATAWCSASPSARRWRWRCATGRCAPREFGEDITAPAQDEEFVISHSDNVQATGFVEHLKLPHYVDFQAELDLVRRMRAEHEARETSAVKPGGGGMISVPESSRPPAWSSAAPWLRGLPSHDACSFPGALHGWQANDLTRADDARGRPRQHARLNAIHQRHRSTPSRRRTHSARNMIS